MLVEEVGAAYRTWREDSKSSTSKRKKSRRSYARDFLLSLVVEINTAVSSPYAAQTNHSMYLLV